MTSSSHLASSAFFYLAATALLESPINIEGLAVTAVGSLLPDIDTPTSSIGRPFFPLARWINQKMGYRTVTHSFLGAGIFASLVMGAAWILSLWTTEESALMHYGWLLILGYGSHILVDTLNKTGVELFWPCKLRCVFFYNEHYRIASAGAGDYWFMTVCLILNLGMYPLARDGFTFSLHQAFGDIYSVSMDFKQYGDKNRIWLDLEGVEAISNQKVQGRFEILAAMDNAAVLIERDGVKQTVSRTKPFQIFPDRTRISIGKEQQITTQEIEMAGRTLGEIPHYAVAKRVLFYGYLTPARFTPVSVYENRYKPISLRLDKLKFEHADYGDIREQRLEHVAIREGILIVKIYRLADATEPLASRPTRGVPIHHLELRFDPTDEILFVEGDVIRAGQVIAREEISIQKERLEGDYRRDLERLNQQLGEVQIQLLAARENLREAEGEREELESELGKLEFQSLFAREYLRLKDSLALASARAEDNSEKIVMLERKRKQLSKQVEARSEQLAESVASLQKDGQIVSSFAGEILRIERKPENKSVVYSVFYRELADKH